jgi:Fungal chitosanase of glycosyl hydrolase group 75
MAFKPPPASAGQCKGVPFEDAKNVAAENKAAFDAFDKTPKGKNDPSKCKALLAFPGNAAIFWSSKMAIDADGPAAGPGRLTGSELDPGPGQDDTKLHFSNGNGLPSETIPYIVLPGGSFRRITGLAFGDVAVVIFKDKITAAICGDLGPAKKIGEGSIRVHEAFHPPAPDPCIRGDNGFCRRIHNVSIDEDVLFFVFPDSALDNLNAASLEARIKERAFSLYNKLRDV